MKKQKDTLIGISVNKSNADKKLHVRDTVFRKGSRLNSFVNFYDSSDSKIGYISEYKRRSMSKK